MSKIMTNDIRKKILAAKPRQLEVVHVPEWGVDVWIRELSLGERDAFEANQIVRGEDGSVKMETVGLKTNLIMACVCDEDGDPIFNENDRKAINNLSASATERVFAACQRVNRMRKEDTQSLLSDPKDSARKNGSGSG